MHDDAGVMGRIRRYWDTPAQRAWDAQVGVSRAEQQRREGFDAAVLQVRGHIAAMGLSERAYLRDDAATSKDHGDAWARAVQREATRLVDDDNARERDAATAKADPRIAPALEALDEALRETGEKLAMDEDDGDQSIRA